MPLYAIGALSPQIALDAWVAPSADIIGDAHLGALSSIWFGAVIRADNSQIRVGKGSNIQDGVMLHSDPDAPLTVGDYVTVGHHATLHGCTIGNGSLIGIGAVVLNHAVIGEDCLVGAGALVTEGKIFPSRQLIVGSPARAIRTLDDAAVAKLRVSADGYIAKQREFAETLNRLD